MSYLSEHIYSGNVPLIIRHFLLFIRIDFDFNFLLLFGSSLRVKSLNFNLSHSVFLEIKQSMQAGVYYL